MKRTVSFLTKKTFILLFLCQTIAAGELSSLEKTIANYLKTGTDIVEGFCDATGISYAINYLAGTSKQAADWVDAKIDLKSEEYGKQLKHYRDAKNNAEDGIRSYLDQKKEYIEQVVKIYGVSNETAQLIDGLDDNIKKYADETKTLWQQIEKQEKNLTHLTNKITHLSPPLYQKYGKKTINLCLIAGCAYGAYQSSEWFMEKVWGKQYKTAEDVIKHIHSLTLLCVEYRNTIAQHRDQLEITKINHNKHKQKILLLKIKKLENLLKKTESTITHLNTQLKKPETIGTEATFTKIAKPVSIMTLICSAAYCGHLLYQSLEALLLTKHVSETDKKNLLEYQARINQLTQELETKKKQYKMAIDSFNHCESFQKNENLKSMLKNMNDINKIIIKLTENLKEYEADEKKLKDHSHSLDFVTGIIDTAIKLS